MFVGEETAHRIHAEMYVVRGNLEAIETAGFCDLNFLAKQLHQVFIYYAITCRRESQNMAYKIALRLQGFPAPNVLGKIHLFSCPKGGLSFLIHLPKIVVLGREDDEAMRVFSQWGLVLQAGGKYLSFWLGGLLEDRAGGLAGQHAGPLRAGGMFSLSAGLSPLRVRAGAAGAP